MYIHFVLKRYAAYSFIFFLLGHSIGYSQDFVYKHYDVQDGLPTPRILGMFQDRDGYLWVGTASGLCRYDGSRFKTFTVKDGLPSNRVNDMFQDSQGRIWLIQSAHGIAYIWKGKVYNQQNDSLLKQLTFSSRQAGITEDAVGNIIIIANYTLYIISYKANSVRRLADLDGGTSLYQQIYKGADGKIILLVDHEPYLPKDAPVRAKQLAEDFQHKKCSIFELNGDRLKFSKTVYEYKEGIYEAAATVLLHKDFVVLGLYSGKLMIVLQDTTIQVKAPISNTYLVSLVSDSLCSFNTKDGAYLFNTNTRDFTQVLPGISVYDVFMDQEKNLWIGTFSEGLYKIRSQVIKNKTMGAYQNDISYLQKEGDNLIAGNSNKELLEVDKEWKIKKIIATTARDFDSRVIYYEKTGEQRYIMAHETGVGNYEKGKLKKEIATNLATVTPLDNENLLVAAHFGSWVVNKEKANIAEIIWERKTTAALKTNDSIFLGAYPGVFILRKEKDQHNIIDSLLPDVSARYIKKTANNLLWLCTLEHGLFCLLNGKVYKHFTDTSGLPSNNGKSLFINGNDVWMGTDKGLVKITQRGDNFHLQTFNTSDGLASNFVNAIYVDSNMVYLGTPKGICFFDENKMETNSICNLQLTGVTIGDSLVDLSDKYSLKTNERISIEYSGISLRSEQEMSYRYKIHGIDGNWRTSKQNLLEFTALPHGEYELEIVAINKFGKESTPLKLMLEVVRPFHKTSWFFIVMILIPMVGVILFINARMNRDRKKQMQKLQQEIRIAKLEQMALRAQMNPHFIFNCISAMQQLITEKDTDNASRFISSFADLVRQTLDNAPELFISLTEEVKFLGNYFELERIRLEDRFSYNISTGGVQSKEQLRVPNMVIQPFVENAIKHGIRYKKNGKGFIEVVFEQQQNLLRCTITDNGVGREKALQMKKESGINHASKGMSITLGRIESLNALTNQQIDIEITDLKDAQQQASGTRVTINFHNINDSYDKDSHH